MISHIIFQIDSHINFKSTKTTKPKISIVKDRSQNHFAPIKPIENTSKSSNTALQHNTQKYKRQFLKKTCHNFIIIYFKSNKTTKPRNLKDYFYKTQKAKKEKDY